MYRRVLFYIIGFGVTMSISIAPRALRVVSAADSKAVVKELDLDGLKKLLARDSKRPRPLLINFWATWCGPCKEEFPDLVAIQGEYKERGLETIFVSLDEPDDIKTIVPQFLLEMRADKVPNYLLNVPDPEAAIKAVDTAWKGALPATFLYDPKGSIAFKHTGRINAADLRAALDKVVK